MAQAAVFLPADPLEYLKRSEGGSTTAAVKLTAQKRYRNKAETRESSVFFGRNDYYKEEVRAKTYYIYWPGWALVEPSRLTAAGFWYTGEGDTVKCFICCVIVDSWKADDVPMTRHKLANPDCPFVRGETTNNVVLKALKSRSSEDTETDSAMLLARLTQSNTSTSGQQHSQKKCGKQLRKKFGDLRLKQNRQRTFAEGWPASAPVASPAIVEAGMYYSGTGVRVVCPYCGTQIDSWRPNDVPLAEHAKRSANCPYLKEINFNVHIRPHEDDVMQCPAVMSVSNMGFEQAIIKRAIRQIEKTQGSQLNASNLLDEIFKLQDELEEDVSESSDEDDGDEDEDDEGDVPYENIDPRISPIHKDTTSTYHSEKDRKVLQELQEENANLRSTTRCRNCIKGQADTLLLPCSHLALCANCGEDIDRCPICDTKILGTVKTYMV